VTPHKDSDNPVTIESSGRGEYRLSTSLWVPYTPDQVFEFFADAFKLESITPPWLHFKILTPAPIEMVEGALIDYRIRLRGIPIRWRTEISRWDPPRRFVDQQLKGPYRLWHHEHRFEPLDGGTVCSDIVHYSVPGGRLLHWLVVRRDLEKIFSYRQQRLAEIFRSDSVSQATTV